MSTDLPMSPPSSPRIRLYHYWRSTSSWRVRWAFALKGIEYEAIAVDLLKNESESDSHLVRNPMGQVPVLEFLDQPLQDPYRFLSESLAIIDWAERTVPSQKLWPENPFHRAKAIELAELINAGTQPLQNLSPQFLYSDDPLKRKEWAAHWIQKGLTAYESIVRDVAGKFSIGDQISIADLCLIPQCYNAGRYEVDLKSFPMIQKIYQNAILTEGYLASEPARFEPKPA